MPKFSSRLAIVPLASFALAVGAAAVSATTASAHDHPTPIANVGVAAAYATNQVQLHVDDEALGLYPALANPFGYTTSHVVPVGVNVVSLTLTGHKSVDDGTGHDHGH
ncbi:hypothetical protein ACFVWG_26840 [Kribbella sp. NPDC058245]|uniref:hypothetical protein n=1 Tax=Kribbella sp. NPDC058245 TaxID=3346399 RepID=UPI0036F07DC6